MMRKNLFVRRVIGDASVWLGRAASSRRRSHCRKALRPTRMVSEYFPNRMYEFVWRNWNAVEPAKLAKILGTSVENVEALAESMGLPAGDGDSAGNEDPRLYHAYPAQLASLAVRSVAGASGDDAGATGLRAARG